MKTCPICHAQTFDDASRCYGCLYRFDDGAEESLPAETQPTADRTPTENSVEGDSITCAHTDGIDLGKASDATAAEQELGSARHAAAQTLPDARVTAEQALPDARVTAEHAVGGLSQIAAEGSSPAFVIRMIPLDGDKQQTQSWRCTVSVMSS